MDRRNYCTPWNLLFPSELAHLGTKSRFQEFKWEIRKGLALARKEYTVRDFFVTRFCF